MFASVICTTYNHPRWLEKTLLSGGYFKLPLEISRALTRLEQLAESS